MSESNDRYSDGKIDRILENIPEEPQLRQNFEIYLWNIYGNRKENEVITSIIFDGNNKQTDTLTYLEELLKDWIKKLELGNPSLYVPALKILTRYFKKKGLNYDGEAINRFLG